VRAAVRRVFGAPHRRSERTDVAIGLAALAWSVTTLDAVLFDLDGTLCRHEQSEATVYYGAFERAGVESFGTPDALWRALDGDPDPDDEVGYLATGFRSVAAAHGREHADAEALARGFLDVVDYAAVSMRPGAIDALAAARERGRVGLVTNGPERRQSVKLASLDLEDAFDVVVYAGDMDRRKPEPDPFYRALNRIDVDAAAAMYVGNSLEYDVAGARRAGLTAVWCPDDGSTDPGEHRPEYVIGSLGELSAVLDDVE
jgi:putative hydrolase of the HAD superfamily